MADSGLVNYYVGMAENAGRLVDTDDDSVLDETFSGLSIAEKDVILQYHIKGKADVSGDTQLIINGDTSANYHYEVLNSTSITIVNSDDNFKLSGMLNNLAIAGAYMLTHQGSYVCVSRIWSTGYLSEGICLWGQLLAVHASITSIQLLTSFYARGSMEYGIIDHNASLIPNR